MQSFADDLLATLSGHSASNVINPLQAFYRRAIDREELANEPTKGIDLPIGASKRPRRIAAPGEAAQLIELLPLDDRALWATAFYAGLRRGELQALRCEDIDLARNLIHVKKGWDQEEGEIEPKSEAAKRTIPLLAILRDFLDAQLVRTGRAGTDRIFGPAADQVFYPSTVDGRARRAWKAYNLAEREAAEGEKRAPVLLTTLTLHECRHTFASLLIDHRGEPESDSSGHGAFQNPDDLRRVRALAPWQLRRCAGTDGRLFSVIRGACRGTRAAGC